MQYRELGKTGIKVSAIGFGAWAIGGPSEASGTPLGWGRTTDDDSLAAIRRARDLGVTFFDTADSYGFGRSESLLGIVLSRKRQDVVIATKVGVVRDVERRAEEGLLASSTSSSPSTARSSACAPTTSTSIRFTTRRSTTCAAKRFRKRWSGCRTPARSASGASRFPRPRKGSRSCKRGWGHALQVLYNILNQAPAQELFPLAKEKGYGIIARVPLASGLLTGKFRTDTIFPADDIRQNFLTPRRLQEALDARRRSEVDHRRHRAHAGRRRAALRPRQRRRRRRPSPARRTSTRSR